MGVLTGFTSTLSRCSCVGKSALAASFNKLLGQKRVEQYLLTTLRIEQYPAKFNDFCGVLCDINAVFVTSRSYMNDYEAVQIGLLTRSARHCGYAVQGMDNPLLLLYVSTLRYLRALGE